MAARDLVPALQTAVEGFNTVVDGKQPTLDAKLPTAQTALDGAREARDGALVARDITIASRDAAYRDLRSAQANLDHQDLAALAASKAVTAVDVFIYDTSRDSDGGAWRKRCAKTSWFNEPLNTATRGARREFPAVAVIVAEIDKVTIYDGDDPDLPMWMVFEVNNPCMVASSTAPTLTSVVGGNGEVIVGSGYIYGGVSRIQFPADTAYRHRSIPSTNKTQGKWILGGIAARHKDLGFNDDQIDAARIINEKINDVAMTVLPDAPIDPATGLPVPTVAVATDGGVSVIKNDGTVVSATDISGFANHNTVKKCDVYGDRLYLTAWNGSQQNNSQVFGLETLNQRGRYTAFDGLYTSPTPFSDPLGVTIGQVLKTPNYLALGSSENPSNIYSPIMGLGLIAENEQDTTRGLSALTTSSYTTGWLPGDIRGAFLADTDATDLVGGTDADRSVKNTPLTVNGTITRAPVATGADLVAYSGFSTANYLEQPYNPGLDFGTGDFCVLGWVYSTDATYRGLVGIEHLYPDANGDTGWVLFTSGSADVRFRRLMDGAIADVGVPYAWRPGWSFFCVARIGATMRLWTNGSYIGENSHSTLAFDVSGSPERTLKIGRTSNYGGKRAALFRISATVPDNDQIHRIYQDEKVLFQENAACTLYGASDAVTALAHDPDTGLLHVGTSAGRSVFKGLRRVANTTQPVTTAISAANGMVIEQ